MFAISEIHPFLDGNGRMAIVMMNAELVNTKQSKIIIPIAYREDYIPALRNLTHQRKPLAFIRMFVRNDKEKASIILSYCTRYCTFKRNIKKIDYESCNHIFLKIKNESLF